MSVGYPDYARLSNSGGFLLYSSDTGVPEFTTLYKGYIGSWPYLNLFTNCDNTTDFARVQILYSSDNTFSDIVGFRYAIRQSGSIASTQYANLTDWVHVFYDSISGNQFPFLEFSVYGTQGYAEQRQLASLDVPITRFSQIVPASTTVFGPIQHIQPGAADLQIQSAVATWSVTVNYYDYASAAFLSYASFTQGVAPTGGSFSVPMPDAPCQLQVNNGSAAAGRIIVGWASK